MKLSNQEEVLFFHADDLFRSSANVTWERRCDDSEMPCFSFRFPHIHLIRWAHANVTELRYVLHEAIKSVEDIVNVAKCVLHAALYDSNAPCFFLFSLSHSDGFRCFWFPIRLRFYIVDVLFFSSANYHVRLPNINVSEFLLLQFVSFDFSLE